MIGTSLQEDVVFLLATLCNGLTLAAGLRFLLSSQYHYLAKAVLGATSACIRTFFKRGGRPQHDEVSRFVDEKADSARLRHMRGAVSVMCVAGSMSSLAVAYNVAMHNVRTNTLAQDVILVSGQAYAAVVIIWPKLITTRTMDVHYCGLVGCASASILPFLCKTEGLLKSLLLTNVLMALLNGARRARSTQRLPILASANAFFALCVSSSLFTHGEAFFSLPTMVVFLQVIVVCLMCFLAVSLESGYRASIHRGMQLEEVKELHGAACAVLRSYCDVVVELDANGLITSSAADLSNFLLRSQRQPSARGIRLVDFIATEEERQLFEERLNESKQQRMGLAENVQVTMKDGCNNTLRLEMMWFEFKRLGNTNFMLGLREFGDVPTQRSQDPPLPMAPLDTPFAVAGDCASIPQVPGPERGAASSLMSNRYTDTGRSSKSLKSLKDASASKSLQSAHLETEAETEAEPPMLVVDTEQQGMPIQAMTPAFCSEVGHLPLHAPLLNFVRSPARLLSWAHFSLDVISAGKEPPPECPVTLLVPPVQSIRVSMRLVLIDDSQSQGQHQDPSQSQRSCDEGTTHEHKHTHTHKHVGLCARPMPTCAPRPVSTFTPMSRPAPVHVGRSRDRGRAQRTAQPALPDMDMQP